MYQVGCMKTDRKYKNWEMKFSFWFCSSKKEAEKWRVEWWSFFYKERCWMFQKFELENFHRKILKQNWIRDWKLFLIWLTKASSGFGKSFSSTFCIRMLPNTYKIWSYKGNLERKFITAL